MQAEEKQKQKKATMGIVHISKGRGESFKTEWKKLAGGET